MLSAGVLVCILPGSSLQIVVAVVLAFGFLHVYISYRPFISAHIGTSKIIAQGQILAIFFLAYLFKEDILKYFVTDTVTALFVLAIFSNLIYDISVWCLMQRISSFSSSINSGNGGSGGMALKTPSGDEASDIDILTSHMHVSGEKEGGVVHDHRSIARGMTASTDNDRSSVVTEIEFGMR